MGDGSVADPMIALSTSLIRVRRAAPAVAALALAVCLGGCGPIRYFGYLTAPEAGSKNVPAEFTGLEGHRVVIVIFADQRVQYEHPQARLTLASVVRAKMNEKLKNVSVTDPAKVCRYQDEHAYWETLEKAELAKQFGADFVLYVTLVEYSTREIGSIDLYRGRITAQCSLYEAGKSDDQGRVWSCDRIGVVYPEAAPAGVPGESSRSVRERAERLWADALVKRFYEHKEPVD
jgi:hypothetical protein